MGKKERQTKNPQQRPTKTNKHSQSIDPGFQQHLQVLIRMNKDQSTTTFSYIRRYTPNQQFALYYVANKFVTSCLAKPCSLLYKSHLVITSIYRLELMGINTIGYIHVHVHLCLLHVLKHVWRHGLKWISNKIPIKRIVSRLRQL